jgi:hypothetical protein
MGLLPLPQILRGVYRVSLGAGEPVSERVSGNRQKLTGFPTVFFPRITTPTPPSSETLALVVSLGAALSVFCKSPSCSHPVEFRHVGRMSDQFRGAPVSKVLVTLCAGLTIVAAASKIQPLLIISSRDAILARTELWRLFTSLVPSESLAEGLLSWFLLYRFRMFERHMGTAKFLSFVLAAFVWGSMMNAAIVALPFMGSGVASGPYVLVFALFVYFYRAYARGVWSAEAHGRS